LLINGGRLIKHGEDRGQSLRRDLNRLTAPVVIISNDPGITGALDEFCVGHTLHDSPPRLTQTPHPVLRAVILKTWRPYSTPELPQNGSRPICQI
jgi:hypothetical protein